MSVQCNTYVMIGAVFPYANFKGKSEDLEPWMDSAFKGIQSKNGITVLYDGMNGKYVAVGKVVAKTTNWEGFDKPVGLEGELSEDELIEFGYVLDVAHSYSGEFTIKPFVITHYR